MVVTGVLAAWALAYMAMVVVVATRRERAVHRSARPPRRVLLVRPCTGRSAAIERAMATAPTIPADVELTWVGCVADATDTAWPLVQQCATDLRTRGITAHALLTTACGPNRKAEQIAVAHTTHGDGHDVLVVVDADIELSSVDVAALLDPLGTSLGNGRSVGATWCPPIEPHASTWGDRASRAVLGGSWHAFSVLSRLDSHVVVGKVLAIHGDALARIGSLHELRDYLGEDFEIGRRIEAAGLEVHAVPRPVTSLAIGRSLAQIVERYTRWIWVVRAQRPLRMLGYPLLIAAAPLLLLGAAALAIVAPMAGAGVALSTLVARAAITLAAGSRGVGIADALLADLVLLVAFVRACTRRTVRWADHTLRLGGDGRLQLSPEERGHQPRKHGEHARRDAVTARLFREQR